MAQELDLAFVLDATGSMQSYIDAAKNSIRSTVEEIVSSENADLHIGVVLYRDHPPQDRTFVTQVHDFTPSVSKVRSTLDGVRANGGGDAPEAVADGLAALLKMEWRPNATRVAALIADAAPHGLCAQGDSFPNGCPAGLDIMEVAGQLAEKEITVHVLACGSALSAHRSFYQSLALITGGVLAPLSSAKILGELVTAGAREEIAMEKLMKELEEDLAKLDGDEEERAQKLHQAMASRGVRSTQMQCGGAALPKASAKAKMWSSKATLAEVRSEYEADAPGAYAPPMPSAACSMAYSAPPAASSAGGGLFSRVRSMFGGSTSGTSDAAAKAAATDEAEADFLAPPAGETSYKAVVSDISYAQCERLVSKAARRSKRST